MRFLPETISIKQLLISGTAVLVATLLVMTLIYYSVFANLVENQVQKSFEQLAADIEKRIDDNLDSIEEAAIQIAYSSDVQNVVFFKQPMEYMRSASSARRILETACLFTSGVDSVYVRNKNGRSFYNGNAPYALFEEIIAERLPEDCRLNKPFYATLSSEDEENEMSHFFYCIPVYNIRVGEYERANAAVCIIKFDADRFAGLLVPNNTDRDVLGILYGESLIASSRKVSSGEAEAMKLLDTGRGSVAADNMSWRTNAVNLPDLNWRIVYLTPEEALKQDILQVRNISFIFLSVALVLLSAIIVFIFLTITIPIRRLVNDMNAIKTDSHRRVSSAYIAELKELATGINQALEVIEISHLNENETQNRLYEATIAQNHAQMLAYRSQTNPHFFMNTLECIRSMARHYGMEQIEKLIGSLASMFRYSLRADMIVPLKDEAEHLRTYMEVMQQRYPGRFKLLINISDEAQDWPVLSIMLQPLAENAVRHAFNDKKSPCTVAVQGWVVSRDGSRYLAVRLTDNGCGIAPDKLKEVVKNLSNANQWQRDHIGFSNINKRLQLVFGLQTIMDIKSKVGHYTSVLLLIPEKPTEAYYEKLPETRQSVF